MSSVAAMHDLVEATPGWVARRLRALAGSLLLPCPVRDAFLFRADAAFYALCTGSVISLQQAARRVVEHLGLRCDVVVVSFRGQLPGAANIQREGNDWFIEIDRRWQGDGPALGAILAHECAHILLAERDVPRFGTAVDEVHVDLALMLAGLGALTINAIQQGSVTRGDLLVEQHRSFGYLRPRLLRYAYAHVAASLGIRLRDALAPLRDRASRTAVGWYLATRLRARLGRLAYAPLAAHVIVPCLSAACPRRLRIPTGATGDARCPECGAARRFDGRPLAARALAAPAPMPAAPLPGTSALARMVVAVDNWPVQARLSLALLVAVFAGIGALWLAAWLQHEPIGGPCTQDHQCRSRTCVRLVRPPAIAEDPSLQLDPALAPAIDAMLAGLDPLAPGRSDPRFIDTEGGVCSEPCDVDDDCPDGFACAGALQFADVTLGGRMVSGAGVQIRRCMRRAL